MEARVDRLMKAMELEQPEAEALVAEGLDTPRKVKAAGKAKAKEVVMPAPMPVETLPEMPAPKKGKGK